MIPLLLKKNIFTVVVNKYSQILVEEDLTDIKDLRGLAMDFLDNGGGIGGELVTIVRVKEVLGLQITRESYYIFKK